VTGRRAARALAVAAVFVGAAVLATYPLVLRLTHAIAGGLGDPILNSTALAWDADRARHGFHAFWDAPFLYPHRHTLAYTEPLIGVALFTAPINWLSGNAILAYNVAYLGSFALAGAGMFVLARHLWGRDDAAILAGLAFALTPYRHAQTTHLQVLMNGWMPVALWCLHLYFETGRRRWLAGFAAAYAVLGLSNAYYLYFFVVAVAAVAGVEIVWPRLPRARIVGGVAAAGAAVALAIAPLAIVFYQLHRDLGFERSPDELAGLSANLTDYFRVADGSWRWGGLVPLGAPERQLFQGVVVFGFAVLGVATCRANARWTRSVVTYVLVTAGAVWLSLGPGPWLPYGLLFQIVPGMNGLRVPARLASVAIVGLAALAGAGLSWMLARVPRRVAPAAALAIAAIIVVEGQHGINPVALTEVPALTANSWDRVAYSWLRDSPPGAVLELDVTQLDDFKAFTTIYQLRSVWHQHPIVNGYAGWKSMLQELLGGSASPLKDSARIPDMLRGLRAIGVRYVMVHDDTFADRAVMEQIVGRIAAAADQIAEEHRWPGVTAWRLTDAPTRTVRADAELRRLGADAFTLHASTHEERLPMLVDGDIDTRWLTGERQNGGEWIEVELARPANIALIRLDNSRRSLPDYPRHVVIESVDAGGAIHTMFDGAIVDRLIEALAVDERRAPVTIDLPPNRSQRLRIRQTEAASDWWSIHELELFEDKGLP